MFPAIIVDDEVANIENLSILLKKNCPEITIAGTATNVDQALEMIKAVNACLLFLDIQMPGKDGFELLKSLGSPNLEVIFVTAYHEYAIQAIRFSAIDYLLKPINVNELVSAVQRAKVNLEKRKRNERLENLVNSISDKNIKRIAIPGNKATYFVDPGSILFCRADNNYTIFNLVNEEKHISSKPIFEYDELLTPLGFVRCHQSYLVNVAFVKSWIRIDGDRLVIQGGVEIPVSRSNREKVRLAIGAK